jgi:hypothetical protein
MVGHRELLPDVPAARLDPPGTLWDFAYARTLPGYSTYTKDVTALDPRST